MRYITVAEFRDFAEKQAVLGLVVHRSPTGYSLVFRLNWRDEEHLLVRHHHPRPREWASFDRLRVFLENSGVKVKELVVKFNDVET